MKKSIFKLVSLLVATVMVMPFAGCSDKSRELVARSAETFVSGVLQRNENKLSKVSDSYDEDNTDLFTYGESDAVKIAVLDELSVDIQDETYEVSRKEGKASVDVVFKMPDYEKVFSVTKAKDEQELIHEIKTSTKVDIECILEFKKIDDDWLVTNGSEVLESVFKPLHDANLPTLINLDDLSYTWGGGWDSCQYNEVWYENVTCIDLTISGVEESELRYVITRDNNILYESDPGQSHVIYDVTDKENQASLDEFSHLAQGTYEIVVYLGDIEIDTCKVHVTSFEDHVNYIWNGNSTKIDYNYAWFNDVTEFDISIFDMNASSLSYTVKQDGELVYTSSNGSYEARVDSSHGVEYNFKNFIPQGTYEITFYSNGIALEPSCIAEVTSSFAEVEAPASKVDKDMTTKFYNQEFLDSVYMARWITDFAEDVEDLDPEQVPEMELSFDLAFVEGSEDPFYYAVWYVEDEESEPDYTITPSSSGYVTPIAQEAFDITSLSCDYHSEGHYYLIIADNENLDNVYVMSDFVTQISN